MSTTSLLLNQYLAVKAAVDGANTREGKLTAAEDLWDLLERAEQALLSAPEGDRQALETLTEYWAQIKDLHPRERLTVSTPDPRQLLQQRTEKDYWNGTHR